MTDIDFDDEWTIKPGELLMAPDCPQYRAETGRDKCIWAACGRCWDWPNETPAVEREVTRADLRDTIIRCHNETREALADLRRTLDEQIAHARAQLGQ